MAQPKFSFLACVFNLTWGDYDYNNIWRTDCESLLRLEQQKEIKPVKSKQKWHCKDY